MIAADRKRWIDNATYEQLLARWRFEPLGSPWFQGELGDYYSALRAMQQIHGIDSYFGGGHGLLAEMFAPDPHVVKTPEELQVKLHVCEPCAMEMSVWELLEAHNETRERQEAES
jgi:hypothetical protein